MAKRSKRSSVKSDSKIVRYMIKHSKVMSKKDTGMLSKNEAQEGFEQFLNFLCIRPRVLT